MVLCVAADISSVTPTEMLDVEPLPGELDKEEEEEPEVSHVRL